MAEVEAAFRAIGHLILIPYYLVVAVNMAGKMMYERGVVYASSSLTDAEEHARKLAAEGKEVVILKTDKASVLERIKSGANNYEALQKRVGQKEIGIKNQKQRNAYQNNLMMAAYGNNDNSPNEENVYGNLYTAPTTTSPKGGRRSKRLTKRSTKRRNGNRKSARR